MLGQQVRVEVQNDFLTKVSQANPVAALAELIWNALDADATEVVVETLENELGVITDIIVKDNGHGIHYDHARELFGSLGGSWKSSSMSTGRGRFLHGQEGKGRFKAFALGGDVHWDIDYSDDTTTKRYSVSSQYENLGTFSITDIETSQQNHAGVTVHISNPHKQFAFFDQDIAKEKLTPIFAFYLMAYKDVSIRFNDALITPETLIRNHTTYTLETLDVEGTPYNYELEIVEWNEKTERLCYLCNQYGFPLERSDRSLAQYKDFSFTAYLKSEHLTHLNNMGLLAISELEPHLSLMLDKAFSEMKNHFNKQSVASSQKVITELHNEKAYPFEKAVSADEKVLRKIFDGLAVQIQEEIPDYKKMGAKAKALHYRLLKLAMEQSPDQLHQLLASEVNLKKDAISELDTLMSVT
ncbi:MAG: ATP-binding protein [Fibrobacterales bacterium]